MPVIPSLDLFHNKLNGPLTNLPYGYVPSLSLECNIFNDSILRKSLDFLDVSRNRLTGKIPKCLESLQRLYNILGSNNQVAGVIPSFKALNLFRRLKLNDNNFVGELPRELGNLRGLRILDLGGNKLSGNIPELVIEDLKSLVVLRLHKNNFTGRIPWSLCKASNLQILDVANNNLEGHIPRCLGELNAMVNNSGFQQIAGSVNDYENVDQVMKGVDLEYTRTWDMVYNMDLSSNQLVGEIPIELTALFMLVGLNLSHNHLSGFIPDNIGNMSALNSLDLSGNELIGVIPPSMAALTFLSYLNLSHNHLSGLIPMGNQLQTLTDPSVYEGNKDLCGPPLPKTCPIHKDLTTTKTKFEAGDEKTNVWLFYVDIICGFTIGFWGVIGVFLFKKQWRQKLFMFAEETMEKIYVVVVVRVNKIRRGREAT